MERARQAPLQNFKESRMLAGGADSSTHLSAYLAAGCISPRMLHEAVSAAAEKLGSEQCQWLIMHLIIRSPHASSLNLDVVGSVRSFSC